MRLYPARLRQRIAWCTPHTPCADFHALRVHSPYQGCIRLNHRQCPPLNGEFWSAASCAIPQDRSSALLPGPPQSRSQTPMLRGLFAEMPGHSSLHARPMSPPRAQPLLACHAGVRQNGPNNSMPAFALQHPAFYFLSGLRPDAPSPSANPARTIGRLPHVQPANETSWNQGQWRQVWRNPAW